MSDQFPIHGLDYPSIDNAPKDGSAVKCVENTVRGFSLYRAIFKGGKWREITFNTICHPTHYRP